MEVTAHKYLDFINIQLCDIRLHAADGVFPCDNTISKLKMYKYLQKNNNKRINSKLQEMY